MIILDIVHTSKLNVNAIYIFVYKILLSMAIAIFLAILVATVKASKPMIAIQSTHETYFNYLPLTQCQPNGINITDGSIQYELLDPQQVLDIVGIVDNVAFWEGVSGGLGFMLNVGDILVEGNYTQIVYYNSSIPNSSPGRQIVLVSFEPDGNIVLSYAMPIIQNGSVTASISKTITTNLTSNELEYVNNCISKDLNPQLTFIGNFSYLVLCPNSTSMFSFNVYTNTTVDYTLNSSVSIAISNPLLLLPGQPLTEPTWNAALLMTNKDDVLFCMFTASQVGCQGLAQEQTWFSNVAERAWGFQTWDEQDTFLDLLAEEPYLSMLNFTGTVVSVYKKKQTIYVESIQNQNSFLTVFSGGKLLMNTQIMGKVIYYGDQQLVIQAPNQTLFLANFVLPYMTVENNNEQPYISWQFQCNGVDYSNNLSIFWSNYSYPSALIVPLKSNIATTTQGVFTYGLDENFQVIGPDFQMFISTSAPINIALLTAPVFYVTYRIVSIVQINFLEQYKPKLLLYLINQLGQLHLFTSGSSYSQVIALRPCGFTNVKNAFKFNQQYYIYNYDGDLCICEAKFTQCAISNSNQQQNSQQTLVDSSNDNDLIVGNQTGNQYILVNSQQIIITSLEGQVTLRTISGQNITSLSSGCLYNATKTLYFRRQFYDDFLFIFCKGDTNVRQYALRNNQFLFNRQIPLYGFMIRQNGSHFAGVNYVFLEVDGNPESIAYNISQQIGVCCILRIDPSQFTVSAIVEIVEALDIVFLQSMLNVDIAYYNNTAMMETDSYLKVYFQNTWISFSQPPVCSSTNQNCFPATYNYSLNFASLLYNFGASFQQQIVYNLTQGALSASNFPFFLELQGSSPSFYTSMPFNFSWLCGPVIDFQVTVDEQGPFISTISTSKVVTFNKLLQTQTVVLQVLDLSQLLPESLFSNLIMVVQSTSISIYEKFNGSWMTTLLTETVPLPDCLYYLYSIPNDTSAFFASSCFNTYTLTPTITLGFNQTDNLTLSISTMNFSIQLRQIQTFPQEGDKPFIVGIEEGPIRSTSGSLMLCHHFCGNLKIQTSINFMIDYDALMTDLGLLVVGLDVQYLNIWLDPPSPSPNQVISANLILQYRSITGTYCDTVTILQALNPLGLTLLLSCPDQYHQLLVNFEGRSIIHQRQFNKFSNCDSANRAKPAFQLKDSLITMIIVQCTNSINTIYTEEYQTINSSSIVITTAYLQVYTPYGPLCGSSWSPVRIIPLSITEPASQNYIIYGCQNQTKLLYQQMNGFLVDSFLEEQPVTQYTLSELTKLNTFPSIQLTVNNTYYQLSFSLPTQPPDNPISQQATYVVIAIFIAVNILTLLFLLCWLVFKHPSIRRRITQIKSSVKSNETSELQQPSSSYPTSSARGDSSMRGSRQQPARRVTEIELFQPRYT